MKRAGDISLALNLLLLGVVTWLMLAVPPPVTSAAVSQFLTNQGWRGIRNPTPPPAREPLPVVVEVEEPFNWAQVESADYRIYLANLRALGCPEPTVRDIIVADVNDLFAARVKALVDEVSGRFWSFLVRQRDFEKVVDEKQEQLRTLRDERDEIFAALFGDSDPRRKERQQQSDAERREQWAQLADFLPEEKRARFVADQAELERQEAEIARTPGLTAAQQKAKREELESAHDRALSEWLTADEIDELRLRQSPAAGVRDRTPGLDLSDAEVRALAKIQLAAPESKATPPSPKTEAQLRELLGPERFAALQRAGDDRYANFQRVVQRLDLPASAAAQAYDIRRLAEDAGRRVQADQSLSADEHRSLLEAIADETRRGIADALGLKAFAAYEKIDGDWLKRLAGSAR